MVVLAFLVRLAFLSHIFQLYEVQAIRDMPFGAETGAVSAAIASGRGFSSPLRFVETGATAWFTPIYPYLLAGVFKLFGTYTYFSNVVIRTLDCAFSAFTCWPVMAIATRAFGKRTGVASGWLWAVLPTAVFFPVIWVWDTALAGLWMALLVAATLQMRGCGRVWAWAGYGALWTVGAMINPSLLSVLPFLGLWALWPLRQNLPHAAKLATISAAIFLAGLIPWTVRNYVVFDQFIPLRSNFGLELWLGNNPEVPDTWAGWLHPNDDLDEAHKYARMTELPYMEEKRREALAFMMVHPVDSTRFIFRRFANNWLGIWDPPADLWPTAPLYLRAMIVANSLFALLSLLGALFAYRARRDAALPLALILLVFPAIFYLTHTSLRYRYPMDPIMAVLTVYAIAYPLSQLARRWSRAPAGMRAAPQSAD